MKTVVQICEFVPDGRRSVERFLFGLAERMRRQGWRTVHVFSGEPGPEARAALAALDSDVLVERLPPNLSCSLRLGRRLREYRPDVLQTHFLSKFDPGLRLLKRASGAPRLIVTDRSSGCASRKSMAGQMLSRLRGHWAARHVDQIIAVSEFVRRRDVDDVHFPADKVQVIHNGVDLTRFRPLQVPRSPTAQVEIVYAGQLIAQKGVATLIRALARLRGSGHAVRLTIAGQGPLREALESLALRLGVGGDLRFVGQIDWLPRLFAEADIVVVPSEWDEAFGFVAVEAAASGACVVASDAGALPEVVGADIEAGVLFRRGDVDDLSAQLAALIADPARRERLRRAARERAVGTFSIERMIERYGTCLEAMAGGR